MVGGLRLAGCLPTQLAGVPRAASVLQPPTTTQSARGHAVQAAAQSKVSEASLHEGASRGQNIGTCSWAAAGHKGQRQ